MTIVYWTVAAVLALFYLYAGGLKLTRRREQLQPTMGWVDVVPMRAVRTLGALEILGALGLVLPPLTGVAPVLALMSAIGLLVLQALAGTFHVSRGEVSDLWLNGVLLVLLVLAALAIWSSTTL